MGVTSVYATCDDGSLVRYTITPSRLIESRKSTARWASRKDVRSLFAGDPVKFRFSGIRNRGWEYFADKKKNGSVRVGCQVFSRSVVDILRKWAFSPKSKSSTKRTKKSAR